jgi:tRNA threonylcarbamoyladenosine biosynthesis protein TsaE
VIVRISKLQPQSQQPSKIASEKSNNLLPKILIFIGIVFLVACVIVIFYPYIRDRIKKKSMNEEIIITNNKDETAVLAERLAKTLKGGDFLAFYGDLGAGKTTFIQGLAKGLGIEKRIISPTFIIMRHYALKPKTENIKLKNFYHVDLYRTQSKHDLLGIGLDQIIQDENNIVALEWSEKMGNLMPKKRIEIKLKYLSDNQREISIKKYE